MKQADLGEAEEDRGVNQGQACSKVQLGSAAGTLIHLQGCKRLADADQMSVWKLDADLGRRSGRGLQHDQWRPSETTLMRRERVCGEATVSIQTPAKNTQFKGPCSVRYCQKVARYQRRRTAPETRFLI